MSLAYDRAGEGPPLVLLHPLGADRHVWDPVLRLLTQRRECLVVDLPGFGESPPLSDFDGPPTPAALAEAVAGLLGSLGLETPHVAGNSLGGWVALELGLRGTAGAVTGIAPAGLWTDALVPKASLGHRLAGVLQPLIGPLAGTAGGRRVLLAGTVAHPDRVPAADAAHLVRAYARASGFVAVNNAMRAGRFTALADIPCPVTLVWPEHDRLVARPRSLPAQIRNVDIADAGHVPMWDRPDAVAEALLGAG